jgi:hypothetical protein
MAIRVAPISDADVPSVADFLHEHLNTAVAAAQWARAMRVPWKVDAPNHGFMLVDGDRVLGAYLAFYADREIDGRTESFCNLGAWCVLPEHRLYGVRLLKALLAQPGYHFTDLSPSGAVVSINSRLGFEFLDTTTALMANLPWPSLPGRRTVSGDPAMLERALTGDQLEIYRDHADAGAAHHLLLSDGGGSCYVIFRRDRRKGLPLFASILYVSNPDVFRRMTRQLGRHLLLRHGIPATLVEPRVTGHRPAGSVLLRAPRRKMFRSPRLAAQQIDYLYSELVCVAW